MGVVKMSLRFLQKQLAPMVTSHVLRFTCIIMEVLYQVEISAFHTTLSGLISVIPYIMCRIVFREELHVLKLISMIRILQHQSNIHVHVPSCLEETVYHYDQEFEKAQNWHCILKKTIISNFATNKN